MLKIGMTGGIGCGKSTAAAFFEALSVPVIDADKIAHQLTQIGQPALETIAFTFGQDFLHADGSLNRKLLKQLIFTNSDKKQQLEAILHPLIYAQITQEIRILHSPYCLICIPLLIETQKTAWVDRVLLIDCSVKQQVQRASQRDLLSEAQVLTIIAQQATRNEKLACAHDILDNSKSTAHLAMQVKKLHNSYLLLSDLGCLSL